ncbi:MAG: diguanylate cyclase [Alphaproteobacteria bacterium]|nr:diguanylate cyclase [Alphaproteobacteria bacterium]
MLLTRGRNPALISMMEFDVNNHARARRAQRLLKKLLFITIETQRGGLLLVGLDKLNIVSGVYGEDTADAIVLAAARRIEDYMRTGDVVGRVGFCKFAVIVNRCGPEEIATRR